MRLNMKKTILLLVVIWVFSYGLHLFRSWYTKIDEGTISHEEFVDLNLPSGTLWASKNIGANAPENDGNFYAWGECEVKDNYYQVNYQFYSGETLPDRPNYYNEETIKVVDIGTNIQGTKYDVASVILGGNSCMPSEENLIELVKECSWKDGKLNGIRGYKITGKNGKSIFLPYSYYWSSNLDSNDILMSLALRAIEDEEVKTVGVGRRFGLNVRAICKQ